MTLYVVATPIGNLEDTTTRSVRVLREVDAVLAEDTRRTRVLLDHHGITTRLHSFHEHSPEHEAVGWAEKLAGGASLALVTDAGTPLVSDPGFALVEAALERGVRVEAVPGASAVLAALAVAGIPCDAFTFAGFLPRQGRERATALASIRHATHATVLYESPRRVAETLVDLRDHVGAERRVALCRELTKLHEEVRRGTAAELAASITGDVLGEVTLVVGGRGEVTEDPATGEKAAEIAKWAVDHGLGARDASELVRLATGLAKSKAYALCLELQGKAPAKAGD